MLPRPYIALTLGMLIIPILTIHAATEFQVINNGSSSYLIDGENNPPITLQRDSTYIFHVSAPGHPFWIKTVSSIGTANAYDAGVTGNGVTQGDLQFTVPGDAPDQLFYDCQFHSPMTGIFTIEGSPAEADTAPAAPEGLMVEAGNGEVTLTWRQSTATDFALYRVYGDTVTSPAKLVHSTSSATDTTVTLTGLTNGITYYSHVTAVDSGGNESNISNEVSATPEGTVKIAADAGGLPQGFVLEQNFPNPFNPVTTLRYTLPIATRVRLAVYTLEGREVVLLRDDWQPAGTHQLQWDGADRWGQTVGSGVYLVRLESGEAAVTRRVLLLK